MKLRKALVIVLILGGPVSCGPKREGQDAQARKPVISARLDNRIPPADRAKYRAVREWSEWKNPYLTVTRDGIEVWSEGRKQMVAPDGLATTLIGLPLSAWPYGRVVAGSEAGLRSTGDDEKIQRNRQRADEVLRDLGLTAEWWPSA